MRSAPTTTQISAGAPTEPPESALRGTQPRRSRAFLTVSPTTKYGIAHSARFGAFAMSPMRSWTPFGSRDQEQSRSRRTIRRCRRDSPGVAQSLRLRLPIRIRPSQPVSGVLDVERSEEGPAFPRGGLDPDLYLRRCRSRPSPRDLSRSRSVPLLRHLRLLHRLLWHRSGTGAGTSWDPDTAGGRGRQAERARA